MPPVPIVKLFLANTHQLETYLSSLPEDRWKPEFIVLHNTGNPTLAMRPHGFTEQHMENLAAYYGSLDWHAGPHFFCDQNGVWVFSSPAAPGVHSPSWNKISWGVEMLGDYDRDSFQTGDGLLVQRNAIWVLATLSRFGKLDSDTLRFHKEDPLTTHKDCPGSEVWKPDIIGQVHRKLTFPEGTSPDLASQITPSETEGVKTKKAALQHTPSPVSDEVLS